MKRIILLLLVLIAIPVIIVYDSNNIFSEIKKDEKWEFVKERVSSGYVGYNVTKFTGPILYDLIKATKQDSAAVKEIVKELKATLPNKEIENYWVYDERHRDESETTGTGRVRYPEDHVIKLYFNTVTPEGNSTVLSDGSTIGRSVNRRSLNGFLNPSLYFLFNKDVSFSKRKQYIQYEFIRKLTLIHPPFSSNSTNSEKEKFKNSIFFAREHQLENSKFSDFDKFLLKKIYSENFNEEFKAYLFDTYSWRYAVSFFNKNNLELFALFITVTIAVIMFIIGFSVFYNRAYKYKYLTYLIPLMFIVLCAESLQNLYYYIAHPEVYSPIDTYFVYLFVSVVIVVVLSFLLFVSDKIFIRERMSLAYKLILKMSFVFFFGGISIYLYYLLNKRDTTMYLGIASYGVFIKFVALLALGRGLLIYLKNVSESLVKEKDVELSRLKQVNAQSELKLLQSHINPHFLYNALNSIAGLAHTNADKTEKMALSLSDLFRYSLNKKGQKMSTIKEEVAMVQNYLEIEKIRFGKRLKFNLQIDTALENEQIPMYMLQPLVENAIKHGISKIRGEGVIGLDIKKVKQELLITISDNGPDFPKGLVSGHGLQTVYDLLRLSYGDKGSLHWENTPQKRIIISINQG